MDRVSGKVIYTAMLNQRGGFESDLTAVRITGDHFRLFVGTTAIKRDLAWLIRHVEPGERVDLEDFYPAICSYRAHGTASSRCCCQIGGRCP